MNQNSILLSDCDLTFVVGGTAKIPPKSAVSSGDHAVKEEVTFEYGGLTVTNAQQLADGTLK